MQSMSMFANKSFSLAEFIDKNKIDAEIISSETEMKTSDDTAAAFNIGLNQVIKSMVINNKKNEYALVILASDRDINFKETAKILEWKQARLVNDEGKIKELTGFSTGCIPPVGLKENLRIIMDKSLAESSEPGYAGSGDKCAVLKITPSAILSANKNIKTENLSQNVAEKSVEKPAEKPRM